VLAVLAKSMFRRECVFGIQHYQVERGVLGGLATTLAGSKILALLAMRKSAYTVHHDFVNTRIDCGWRKMHICADRVEVT
jgi:hypothetical protein